MEYRVKNMTSLTIQVPDELARDLQAIAATEQKSVQQLAIERLSSLVKGGHEQGAGSPAAVFKAMHEPPHLSAIDVDELDAAIAAGRLAIRTRNPFSA